MSEVTASSGKKNWSSIFLIGGIVFLAITLYGVFSGLGDHNPRPVYGLLIMFTFYLSIGLGMIMLTMIHHIFGSGW